MLFDKDHTPPAHYERFGMECMERMKYLYGAYNTGIFFLLSAEKYRFRAGYKDSGCKDIEKAVECEKLAQQCFEESGQNFDVRGGWKV